MISQNQCYLNDLECLNDISYYMNDTGIWWYSKNDRKIKEYIEIAGKPYPHNDFKSKKDIIIERIDKDCEQISSLFIL